MTLRETLKATVSAGVARCAPPVMQHATSGAESATSDATAVQQQGATPHRYMAEPATPHATGVQQPRCTTPRNTAPDATARLVAALVQAVNRTCDARGDDSANRAELIADALALPVELQADLLAHFTVEAARYG
jgi:hypothetical protein